MTDSSLNAARSKAPLAVRMRPKSLEEVVGQTHLTAPGSPLAVLASAQGELAGSPVSVILWGPPGTGKTTLAQAVAHSGGRRFVELSAVTAGVKDVRMTMEKALNDRDLYGVSTVLFLDEIHRFTKAQQDALLPGVENGWVTLIAATTENPSFSVVSPLLSRSILLTLVALTDSHLREVTLRAIADPRGLNDEVVVDEDALDAIVRLSSGDARRALTALEAAASAAQTTDNGGMKAVITLDTVSASIDRALLRYDRNGDEHYDVISAFIKSVRGSDPDAAVHYLARMIEAGEDARFIARRLIILAAEDIGLADPQALTIAVAAAEASQFIGLPEARIPLAEATIYLSTAPKSNAAYTAIDAAIAEVRTGGIGRVPAHLRDSHYANAKSLGHGAGYIYPHDDPRGVAQQAYLPTELTDRQYYVPGSHGAERVIAERLEKIRRITRSQE